MVMVALAAGPWPRHSGPPRSSFRPCPTAPIGARAGSAGRPLVASGGRLFVSRRRRHRNHAGPAAWPTPTSAFSAGAHARQGTGMDHGGLAAASARPGGARRARTMARRRSRNNGVAVVGNGRRWPPGVTSQGAHRRNRRCGGPAGVPGRAGARNPGRIGLLMRPCAPFHSSRLNGISAQKRTLNKEPNN